MQREARKYLSDIQQAVTLLAEFTAGKQFSDYEGDAMLRAAVERESKLLVSLSRDLRIWTKHSPPASVNTPASLLFGTASRTDMLM